MPTLQPKKARPVTRSASAQAKNRAARAKKTATATRGSQPTTASQRRTASSARASAARRRTPGQPAQATPRGRTPGQPTRRTAAASTTARRRTMASTRTGDKIDYGKRGIYSERAKGGRMERVGQMRAPGTDRGRRIAAPGMSLGDETARAGTRRVTRSAAAQRRTAASRAPAAPKPPARRKRGIYSETAGEGGFAGAGRMRPSGTPQDRAAGATQGFKKKPDPHGLKSLGKRGQYSERAPGARFERAGQMAATAKRTRPKALSQRRKPKSRTPSAGRFSERY